MKKTLLLVAIFIFTMNTAKANLWDLQLSFSAEDSSGLSNFGAVTFIDSVFWVSQWNTGDIAVFDETGSIQDTFEIAGIENIRALSWTGSVIYASNRSDTIFEINAASRSIVNKIFIGEEARFVCFDEFANGGLGGLWGGAYDTDIKLYDLNGVVLDSILESDHGYDNAYGIAIDYFTPGGPYLWVHHRGAASNSLIDRFDIANNIGANINFDVEMDLGIGNADRRGLFITDDLIPGEVTIGGLTNTNPETVFAYELGEIGTIIEDGSINDELREYPINHAMSSLEHKISFGNFKVGVLDSLNMSIDVLDAGSVSVYQEDKTILNIPGNAVQDVLFTNMTPAIGTYTATITTMEDGILIDSDTYEFEITEERMARDDGNFNGAYSVNTGNSVSEILARYDLTTQDSLGVIHLDLDNPNIGDTTFGVIYSNVGGAPGALIASTPEFVIEGPSIDLWFSDTIILAAGSYFFGAHEKAGQSLRIATSTDNYRDDVNFYMDVNGDFQPSGNISTRAIHPVFNWDDVNCTQVDATIEAASDTFFLGDMVTVSINSNFSNPTNIVWKLNGTVISGETSATYNYDANTLGDQVFEVEMENSEGCTLSKTLSINIIEDVSAINEIQDRNIGIYPNPTSSLLNINLNDSEIGYHSISLRDLNGKAIQSMEVDANEISLDVSEYSKGVYLILLEGEKGNSYHKVFVK